MKRTLSLCTALVLDCALCAPAFAEGPDGKALYASKCAMCHEVLRAFRPGPEDI